MPKGSWDAFGLCRDDSVDAQLQRRAQLIKAFVSREVRGVQVFMDPNLHEGRLFELAGELLGSKRQVDLEFGVDSHSIPTPEVFVYRDVEAMQHWLCVHGSAVAYYDGSMHVVMQGDWRVSILHEYVHHELAGLSIAGPMWFHEGEAMRISKEDWWDRLWRAGQFDDVIPFDQLIAPHVHDTSEAEVVAYYGQARLMVSFLWWLNDRQEQDQISALGAGTTDVAGLFAWSAHLDDPLLLRAFTEFVQTHGEDAAMQAWERRYLSAQRLQLLDRAREQHGRQSGP